MDMPMREKILKSSTADDERNKMLKKIANDINSLLEPDDILVDAHNEIRKSINEEVKVNSKIYST